MENIVELNDSKIITSILNRSFLTFAEEFNFTKENAPNHLAFINSDEIIEFEGGTYVVATADVGEVVGSMTKCI